MSVPPKSLRICGVPYRVHFCGDADMQGDGHAGECCFMTQRIRVRDILPRATARNVLWHEVGEAIKNVDSLEMDHVTMTVAFNRALEVLDGNPTLRAHLWGGK